MSGLYRLKRRFLRKIKRILNRFYTETNESYVVVKRNHDTKTRLKKINGGYNGSKKEYRETVLAYWEKYGQKPKKCWYDLYCSGMDAYDPHFLPDPIWRKCLFYFNAEPFMPAYDDKAAYHRLLPGVRQPNTIVKRVAGFYYDGDGEHIISREEAEALCESEEHLIFKPSGGKQGHGIAFYDRDDPEKKSIRDIINSIQGGFVAQQIVRQHPDMAKLNPSSLNTVRVISFYFKEEVHILSAQLRIGGVNARVDNVSSGGSACSIYPDGRLHEKSVTRQSTWTDKTANGILLKSIRVPSFDKVIDIIKQSHSYLPHFRIVGWDFAIGENGDPIMIEFNTKPAQNQIGGREPTFGDITDEVLDEVFIQKTLKKAIG